MTHGPDHTFDKEYWEQHWQQGRAGGPGSAATSPPNPYLAREVGGLAPGTALDAGCGAGAEAIWLASHGWRVTAVDISAAALARAAERTATGDTPGNVHWVEADLGVWDPGGQFDLVTTHYAHPAMPQLDFYERLAGWVAPGGTLLIVGHAHGSARDGHGHDGQPPEYASATAAAVTARLDVREWDVVTAEETSRTPAGPGGPDVLLHDVVVRATRRNAAVSATQPAPPR